MAAGSSQHWVQPVPLYQDQSVRSLAWEAAQSRWKWVIDKRTVGAFGGAVNRYLPWGCMSSSKAAFLFQGGSGTHGDTLRDDSMRAFSAGGEMTFPHGVADNWIEKQEAYGPSGKLMPRPKRHQHWDRNRDAAYVRQALETEAVTFFNNRSNVAGGNLWYTYSDTAQTYGSIDGNSPGNHACWGTQLHSYAAMAYQVPGIAHFVERNYMQHPWVWFYREVDGSIVSAANHPNMIIDRGAPGELTRGLLGDMLGKTALQQWRDTASSHLIVAENTGSAYLAPDIAHWENSGVCAHPVVFGDRGVRRIAEHLCYTTHLGYWQPMESRRGATGESRGFGRGGLSMASWFLWTFGADPLLAQRAAQVLYSHYFIPARDRDDLRFPGRVIKTHNVYDADAGAGVNRVALHLYRYFRPWEDTLALVGAVGIARLITHLYPVEGAGFATLARTTASDVLRYGSPRVVDETTGALTYSFQPYDYIGGAFAFLNGTRHLTAAEIAVNNYALCQNTTGDCPLMLDGYALLRSGSGSFAHALNWWVLSDAAGSQDLMLHRYIRQEVKDWDFSRPNTNRHVQWLIEQGRHGGIGYQDRPTLGATTTRGNAATNASDITVSRVTSDAAWLTGAATGNWRRVSRATGALQTSVAPPVGLTSPAIGWTGIVCYLVDGVARLSGLDGDDPTLSRASYKIVTTLEATPTVLLQTTTFTFPGGTKYDCRAIAWDRAVGAWLVLGRRGTVSTLWLVYPGATVAIQYTGALVDSTTIESMAIDPDGRLLAMADSAGLIHIYGRGEGGIWGVPRTSQALASCRYVAFTTHARTDDAQRLVTCSVGVLFSETEV
jgi:hypothetical protein